VTFDEDARDDTIVREMPSAASATALRARGAARSPAPVER
jgi:hypothetical protein